MKLSSLAGVTTLTLTSLFAQAAPAGPATIPMQTFSLGECLPSSVLNKMVEENRYIPVYAYVPDSQAMRLNMNVIYTQPQTHDWLHISQDLRDINSLCLSDRGTDLHYIQYGIAQVAQVTRNSLVYNPACQESFKTALDRDLLSGRLPLLAGLSETGRQFYIFEGPLKESGASLVTLRPIMNEGEGLSCRASHPLMIEAQGLRDGLKAAFGAYNEQFLPFDMIDISRKPDDSPLSYNL